MNYKKQGEDAVKKMKARYGAAWDVFGASIQDAIVCQEVVSIAVSAASVGGGTCADIAAIVDAARSFMRQEATC